MAFNALKHRNIAQVHGMFEWLVGFMASFAFSICQAAQVDRVLNGQRLENCCRSSRVRQNGVTNRAIVGNHLAGIANVLTSVTTETT